eukprot:scaffold132358_cov48-Phaeocystis_antarctica.AAC.1
MRRGRPIDRGDHGLSQQIRQCVLQWWRLRWRRLSRRWRRPCHLLLRVVLRKAVTGVRLALPRAC